MIDEKALLPCPFCGGEPTVSTRQDESLWSHNTVTKTHVSCLHCDVSFESEPGYELEAPEAWNRRSPLAYEAAKPAPASEAVAWMYTHEDGTRSFVADPDTKRIWEETMRRVLVPVYLHPAPADPRPEQGGEGIAMMIDRERLREKIVSEPDIGDYEYSPVEEVLIGGLEDIVLVASSDEADRLSRCLETARATIALAASARRRQASLATPAPATAPAPAAEALRNAAVEFCRRVEAGEIRSKRSYAAFKAALAAPASAKVEAEGELRFVFDKFPCPDGARFIEVEDKDGFSLNAGEWRKRDDGLVELVVRLDQKEPG